MTIRGKLCLSAAAIGIAVLAAAPFSRLCAQQPSSPPGVTVGQADLGGTVSGAGGPEAGVWVIAETTDLPTKFAKIVVTDDQGRYLIPDLPKANYRVWVRGFGLVDSAKVPATPGSIIDLRAVVAPSDKDAAQYYPAHVLVRARQCPGEERIRDGDDQARASGSPSSRPAPAIRATGSALRECGRSRRSSASSSRPPRPGPTACRSARRPRS